MPKADDDKTDSKPKEESERPLTIIPLGDIVKTIPDSEHHPTRGNTDPKKPDDRKKWR